MTREPGKISVVIPTFNGGHLLSRAVESVLSQTYAASEVIVVDDGSTDGSTSTLQGCFPSVRVIHTARNSGSPGEPRTVGIQETQGDWVALLDSDDYWLPGKLEVQIALAQRGVWAQAANAMRESWNDGLRQPYFSWMPEKADALTLVRRNWVITSSIFVRRDLLQQCMPFPVADAATYEDLAVWLRIASITPIHLLSEPLVTYRDGDVLSFKHSYGHPAKTLKRTVVDFETWCTSTGRTIPQTRRLASRFHVHHHNMRNYFRLGRWIPKKG